MKQRDGKDRLAYFYYNGKMILYTLRSHGRGDLGRIEHAIRHQLRVDANQLTNLKNCPMSYDDYVAHLKKLRLIDDTA